MGKKMTRSPSRKRNSSVTPNYRDKSPDSASVSRASGNFGPSSILKSNKKLKKMRPKTAERSNSRMNSGYKPTRTVYKPEISASAGQNFSPYQVPNVAVIPSPSYGSRQVSFAGNQKRQIETFQPMERSPLRSSPRKETQSYNALP